MPRKVIGPGQELLMHFSDPDGRFGGDVDGRFGRIVLIVLTGVLAAGFLLALVGGGMLLVSASVHELLVLAGVLSDDRSMPWPVAVWAGVCGSLRTVTVGWLAVRAALIIWRRARGGWWLRLSSEGFEVNDRVRRPRRHQWREIDKFMLVNGVQVCYRYPPGRRRTLANRFRAVFSGLRDHDGVRADGLIMGYWDRPFDEAVDLMNEWLARYTAT